MKSKIMFRNALVLAALGASAGLASAGSANTGSIPVSATVASNCLISAPSALNFGVYDPLSSTPITVESSFNVKCSKGLPYTVSLSAGGSSSEGARTMANGSADAMTYSIYSNSGMTSNWGTSLGAISGSGAGLNTSIPMTMYGRIDAFQYTVGVGSYADTVVATGNSESYRVEPADAVVFKNPSRDRTRPR